MASIKYKLGFFSAIVLLAVGLCVSFSYYLSVREIRTIMISDVTSVANSLEQSINYIAANKPDAYRDPTFKKFIYGVKIGRSGYPFMLDENGVLAVHFKDEGQNLEGQTHIDFIRSHKEGGIYEYTASTTGQKKIVGFRYIKPWKLWIVPGVNEADYFEQMQASFVRWNILVGAVIILILVTISFWITRSITAPLSDAIHVANRLAEGDLTVAVVAKTRCEGGQLLTAMKNMVEKLTGMVVEVKTAADQVSTASDQIAVNVEQQAGFSTQLSSSMEEISATMSEFSSTASQIANHSQEVVAIADRTLQGTKDGAAEVEALTMKMSDINRDNESSLQEIMALGRKSQEITSILELIRNIANQTKLIAFNAALEAASAGDAGKRFGVVAVEIRRLADSVVESTGVTEAKITEILEAVNRLVIASEKGSKGIREGLDYSGRTMQMLCDVVNGAAATSEAAKQISLSTQQQQIASSQVTLALLEIQEGGVMRHHQSSRSTGSARNW